MRPGMRYKSAVVAASLALSCFALGAKAAEFDLKMAIISNENSIYYKDMAKPFVDLVGQLTDGKVSIEILPAGTVGSVLKLHEAVEDGLIDMAQTTPIFLGTKDVVNAMIASFPTGLGVDSYGAWLYNGGGLELWQEHRAKKMGLHALVTSLGPSEFFAHSNVPIRNGADLKGKRFRTLGNWAAIVKEAWGAAPTVVAGSEIYGMLEKGALDMAEYSTPSENAKIGFQEIAKYIEYPGIQAPAWAFETVMTTDKWNSLPADIRQKMTLAAELAFHRSLTSMIMADLAALDKMRGGGNEFVKIDDAFVVEARKKAREWALRESAGDELALKVAHSIFDFQDYWQANAGYLVYDYQPGITPK